MVSYVEYLKKILSQTVESYHNLKEIQDKPGDLDVIKKEMLKINGFIKVVTNNVDEYKIPVSDFKNLKLKLNLVYLFDDQDGPEGESIEMELTEDQVWEISLDGSYHSWFYHYAVTGQEVEESGYFDPDFRIIDSYAKAVCGPLGPGIVVDEDFFRTEHIPFKTPHWHDLVIAEAHVRDLTANASVSMSDEERLGYRGLNKWIDDEAFYLKKLGVNAVELQPVHEFDSLDNLQIVQLHPRFW